MKIGITWVYIWVQLMRNPYHLYVPYFINNSLRFLWYIRIIILKSPWSLYEQATSAKIFTIIYRIKVNNYGNNLSFYTRNTHKRHKNRFRISYLGRSHWPFLWVPSLFVSSSLSCDSQTSSGDSEGDLFHLLHLQHLPSDSHRHGRVLLTSHQCRLPRNITNQVSIRSPWSSG